MTRLTGPLAGRVPQFWSNDSPLTDRERCRCGPGNVFPLPAPPTVDTADLPTPVNTGDLPVQIRVTVGVDSGAARVEQVPLGASVILAVTNPDSEDEFEEATPPPEVAAEEAPAADVPVADESEGEEA